MHTKLSIALGGVYLKVYTCVWRESSGKNGNPFSQYARSKRPADSVHWHAPSVPANLGRRISERMGRLTLGPYWPASRSKCVGQPHVQSVWAECHLSSARANGSPY